MREFRINVASIPNEAMRYGPEVGDVFKKDGGPPGFMLIVACTTTVAFYIAFNTEGRITGAGQGTTSYFARRTQIGRVEEFPPLDIIWE